MASNEAHTLPIVLSPSEAAAAIDAGDSVLIIDLSKPEVYAQAHLPGAVSFAYSHLVAGQPPDPGILNDLTVLAQRLGEHGISTDRHIIAYDDEGGGKAARLCWTLHYLGHTRVSVIDGGLHGWMRAEQPVTQRPATPQSTRFDVRINPAVLADSEYITNHLDDDAVQLLDARTPGEHAGTDVRAHRGGHIPGAVNINWLDTIDRDNGFMLRPRDELMAMLSAAGLDTDKETIAYCQTHHRSSHSYVMLKHLGFKQAKGYAGSWSEWGNSESLPVSVPD